MLKIQFDYYSLAMVSLETPFSRHIIEMESEMEKKKSWIRIVFNEDGDLESVKSKDIDNY